MQLSICIPTYNFGGFIGQTLDSLLSQVTDETEVVVLDGGSTDNTSGIVAARMLTCKQLKYHRQDFRGGIDADIEKVVSLARGRYCWLFSADDILMPGAIGKVLQAVKSNHEIYICEHILCGFNMEPIRDHPAFNNIFGPTIFHLAVAEERRRYFRLARTSEAFFS
jgi:abequosyltransferase